MSRTNTASNRVSYLLLQFLGRQKKQRLDGRACTSSLLRRNPTVFVGKVQTAVPPPVFPGSSAAERFTIRVARATFRPARFAPRAVRRTARRAFRIAFRPARRILRASRPPVRRDRRADRRLARIERRLVRLACLFLRGMVSSLTMMALNYLN
jgi:hypothetical protein